MLEQIYLHLKANWKSRKQLGSKLEKLESKLERKLESKLEKLESKLESKLEKLESEFESKISSFLLFFINFHFRN